jgi:CRISPR-associated protein Csd1
MTVLQALDRYYYRMADRGDVPEYGFTYENISYALCINRDGSISDVIDLRSSSRGKPKSRRLMVPRPKRTSNIQSNFLWDKTAYAFGVDSGKSKRLDKEHQEFKRYHNQLLSHLDSEHARAFLAFLEGWRPELFLQTPFRSEMLDQSFVFCLAGEHCLLHEVPLLRQQWLSILEDPEAPIRMCLVTGQQEAIETGHPIIKGVDAAQTSGAYLVSFNDTAYTSYGRPKDATNGPVSKAAAARYGAALNQLLERAASRNRIRIGDATVVFWADSSGVGEGAAAAAERAMAAWCEPLASGEDDHDAEEAVKLRDALALLAQGRPIEDLGLGLKPGTRFYVLGLAPNAARLAIRYWLEDDFSAFARRLADHHRDLLIDPAPWRSPPSIQRLLVRTTALQQKFDNIPPLLAGEVARAVLTGARYPRALLAAAITRLRAGDNPGSGWHAAAIKACTNRSEEEKVPEALDPANRNPAYQLGRLFALLEAAQYAALGRVNAPIGDRYYGAASATPARVFGPLLRGLRNHLSDARKRGRGSWIEPRIIEIIRQLPAELPRSLRLEDQGRFAVGYYHERATRASRDPNIEDLQGDQE